MTNDIKTLRHVQFPNNISVAGCTPKDAVVYCALRSFRNGDTNQCNPSLRTLADMIGISVGTVRTHIDHLEKIGAIKIEKGNRGQNYRFYKCEEFEPFSYDFIKSKDLTFTEKGYLILAQKHMIINSDNSGKISFSNKDLEKLTNIPEITIKRCNESLKKKQMLTIIDTNARDLETGCTKPEKIFHLKEYGQAIAYVLRNHEDRIVSTECQLEELRKQVESMQKDNELLIKEVKRLQKEKDEKTNPKVIL